MTIYLPANVPAAKAAKLERWGAQVVWAGTVWDEANAAALAVAGASGAPPTSTPSPIRDAIAGQGTLALEILDDAAGRRHLIVAAIGGGGLIAGVATAVKGRNSASRG